MDDLICPIKNRNGGGNVLYKQGRFSQRPFPAVRPRKVVSTLILVIGELEQPH